MGKVFVQEKCSETQQEKSSESHSCLTVSKLQLFFTYFHVSFGRGTEITHLWEDQAIQMHGDFEGLPP